MTHTLSHAQAQDIEATIAAKKGTDPVWAIAAQNWEKLSDAQRAAAKANLNKVTEFTGKRAAQYDGDNERFIDGVCKEVRAPAGVCARRARALHPRLSLCGSALTSLPALYT